MYNMKGFLNLILHTTNDLIVIEFIDIPHVNKIAETEESPFGQWHDSEFNIRSSWDESKCEMLSAVSECWVLMDWPDKWKLIYLVCVSQRHLMRKKNGKWIHFAWSLKLLNEQKNYGDHRINAINSTHFDSDLFMSISFAKRDWRCSTKVSLFHILCHV